MIFDRNLAIEDIHIGLFQILFFLGTVLLISSSLEVKIIQDCLLVIQVRISLLLFLPLYEPISISCELLDIFLSSGCVLTKISFGVAPCKVDRIRFV